MQLRTLLFLTAFLLLFPLSSTLAAGDGGGSLWGIRQNLPANHPCADAGGVWRGWCMNMHVSAPPRLTVTGGGSRETFLCRDVAVLGGARTACYLDWRRSLWGE